MSFDSDILHTDSDIALNEITIAIAKRRLKLTAPAAGILLAAAFAALAYTDSFLTPFVFIPGVTLGLTAFIAAIYSGAQLYIAHEKKTATAMWHLLMKSKG